GGPNFDLACEDLSRTIFDDSTATSITTGSPPFINAFRPEGSLISFADRNMNGNWRLRITDNFVSSTPDTLRCWSLLLYPLTCAPGSGLCDTCLPAITNAISAADPRQNNRWFRDSIVSSCASPK